MLINVLISAKHMDTNFFRNYIMLLQIIIS